MTGKAISRRKAWERHYNGVAERGFRLSFLEHVSHMVKSCAKYDIWEESTDQGLNVNDRERAVTVRR